MTAEQIRVKLRKACNKAGSQSKWALHHGISPPYLSDVLNGRRDPGPAILNALGLKVTKIYRSNSRA